MNMIKVTGYHWEYEDRKVWIDGKECDFDNFCIHRIEAPLFFNPEQVIKIGPLVNRMDEFEDEASYIPYDENGTNVKLNDGEHFAFRGKYHDLAAHLGGERRFLLLPVTEIVIDRLRLNYVKGKEQTIYEPVITSTANHYFDPRYISSIFAELDQGPKGSRGVNPDRCLISLNGSSVGIDLSPEECYSRIQQWQEDGARKKRLERINHIMQA